MSQGIPDTKKNNQLLIYHLSLTHNTYFSPVSHTVQKPCNFIPLHIGRFTFVWLVKLVPCISPPSPRAMLSTVVVIRNRVGTLTKCNKYTHVLSGLLTKKRIMWKCGKPQNTRSMTKEFYRAAMALSLKVKYGCVDVCTDTNVKNTVNTVVLPSLCFLY